MNLRRKPVGGQPAGPGRALLPALVLAAAVVAFSCGDSKSPPVLPAASPPDVVQTSTPEPTAAATATPLPPDPGAAAAALEAASQFLREGRFDEAAAAFRAVAAAAPAVSDARAEALMGGAIADYERRRHDQAISGLRLALAASRPQTVTGVRAAYLLGRRLNEAARWAEAEAALAPVRVAAGTLETYVAFEYGRAAAHAGHPEAAAAAWDRALASPGVTAAVEAAIYRERADGARDAGDATARLAWLAKLVAVSGAPAGRFEYANAAAASGDIATFTAQLRAIIFNSPGTVQASLAVGALRAGGYALDAGAEGLVHYRRGAYTEARRVLSAAASDPAVSAADRAFRYFYLAAAYEDTGDYASAIANYDLAAAQSSGDRYHHRARYWGARMAEALGDRAAASGRYAALFNEGPAGEFTDDSAFRAGFTLFEAGDPAAAIAAWETLGLRDDAALLYWKGRAHAALGDAVAASASYRQAAEVEPLQFHALEAARQLGERGPADVTYRRRALDASADWEMVGAWLAARIGGSAPAASPPGLAAELLAAGLRPEAAAAVNDAAAGATGWALSSLVREAHGLGLTDVSARLAVRLRISVGVSDWEIPAALMQVTHPVSYVTLLDGYGREYGLDPLFIAAMVRQESFWNPAAGSHAGARGLTQVIPPTCEAIAAALGFESFRPDDLFRPAVSLQFGAQYLSGQVRRFGNPYHALAAYNAGPGNASRWASRTEGKGPADYVEAVEFAETKGYVQSVMEHYAHYLVAYAS
ncbi:MAG: transglycosylase SLT domain-containing protein [Tepidiformaceae bacterium]